jgi:subtilisin family serine protease
MHKALVAAILILLIAEVDMVFSQESGRIDLLQNITLKTSQEDNLEFIVRLDKDNAREILLKSGARIKYSHHNLYAISIAQTKVVGMIKELKSIGGFVDYNMGEGMPLNNQAVKNNGVESVHTGSGGLNSSYTGKGVIIGIIDTGIDINHPDFRDSTGKSRIRLIWDQKMPFNQFRTPQPYNYGQEWISEEIDGGICTHNDDPTYYGHGTNVLGSALGNGLAVDDYKGMAPDAEIIAVATSFGSFNWLATVADAVHYIFTKADSLGLPCVINASIGTYLGSHDATDLAAQMIEAIILEKRGRIMVCAAGNKGDDSFHLGYQVTQKTSFTWFKYNPLIFGNGGMYFQLWADTADFNDVEFSLGVDKVAPYYEYRGGTPFLNIKNRLNAVYKDTIFSLSNNKIGILQTYAELQTDKYFIEMFVSQPDTTEYLFRFSTKGTGRFDVWSAPWMRTSEIILSPLPDISEFPEIINYVPPDNNKTIVSSFTCSPEVLTVGSYTNRNSFISYYGNTESTSDTPGEIAANSSRGPTRRNILKPEITATGNLVISAGRLGTLAEMILIAPQMVAQGGFHNAGGGTSMASPMVAGIAALYLEKCPRSNNKEIIEDITVSARQDNFTGTVPNNTYGHGKADGLAALLKSEFNVKLNYSGSNIICAGEQIELTTISDYSSYFWSTGESSPSIVVKEPGEYFITVTDEKGCTEISDKIILGVSPLPEKPYIIKNADTLFTLPANFYQWYLNNQPITGANSQYLIAREDGFYMVMVENANECSALSDPLEVQMISDEDFHVVLLPNPTEGFLFVNIRNNISSINTINIYNQLGEEVLRTDIINASNNFLWKADISSFSKGVYFIKVSNEFFVKVERVIKN